MLKRYDVDTTAIKRLLEAKNPEAIQTLTQLGEGKPKLAYYFSSIPGVTDSRSWGFAISEYEVAKTLLFFYRNYIMQEGTTTYIDYNGGLSIGLLDLKTWIKSCEMLFEIIPDDDKDTWAFFSEIPEITVLDRPNITYPNKPRVYAQGKLVELCGVLEEENL